MSDQPTLLDGPFDACPVFIDATARAQERQTNQFYRDPLIPVGLSRVGQLDELASSLRGQQMRDQRRTSWPPRAVMWGITGIGRSAAGEFGHCLGNSLERFPGLEHGYVSFRSPRRSLGISRARRS